MVIEGRNIGVGVNLCRDQADVRPGSVAVTNYEMMHRYDNDRFGGLVLDESSILKQTLGKIRTALIEFANPISYRLAATATPAPNDLSELLNHAAYMGIMSVKEAQALWFCQDGQVQNWRLKGYAEEDFWKWVATWAIAARSPRDIGHEMAGYDLPELRIIDHIVKANVAPRDGELFVMSHGIHTARKVRRETIADRVEECSEIVNQSTEPWVIWCELNDESTALAKSIGDASEITGSDSMDSKIRSLVDFTEGRTRVLVTKPSIAGHGMNWQHCSRMAFIGAGYSYESYYQAVRRCWRYGQTSKVEVHRFSTDLDHNIIESVSRKERQSMSLYDKIPWQMNGSNGHRSSSVISAGESKVARGPDWSLWMGDSVDTIDNLEKESVGLSVFSPPFPGMYVYTDSPHDMGNVQTIGEMVEQFRFLAGKMLRVMMPGRSVFIHITQGVAQLGRDGYMGMKDFRGDLIEVMSNAGWIYYGEVTIDKNPQLKAIRTKDAGLMFKSLANDAARMHPALSDMLLQFKRPGQNAVPIRAGRSEKYGNMAGWVTNEEWILWARPVWYAADYQPSGSEGTEGIRESDVMNVSAARADKDERHLCPLQLGVIERCVKVWSNPGDLVYSPFAGVGSEGVVALQQKRRFAGGELKREYWETACKNLNNATSQKGLFDE